MKKPSFLLALMSLVLGSLTAQQETKTLMSKVSSWGILVSPQASFADIGGEQTAFTSIQAGFIFNQNWIIGAHAGASLMEVPRLMPWGMYEYLDFYQGGLYLEYRLMPSRLVHFTVPVKFGVLITESDQDNVRFPGPWPADDTDREYANFYLEPGINLELNVSKMIRLHVGASYRFNDALFTPNNTGLKIPHHLMLNTGITLGIDDIPKTFQKIKASFKK